MTKSLVVTVSLWDRPASDRPRVPLVSRLLALAIHYQGLLDCGEVADQAELARLGGVTRARMTQIMNLLHLAPAIQEELLFFTYDRGRDPIILRDLQPICRELDWSRQRRMWKELVHSPGQG